MLRIVDSIDPLEATGMAQDEAEADLLGTLIFDAETGAYAARELLAEAAVHLTPLHFRRGAFRALYAVMIEVGAGGVAPDSTILIAEMRSREPDYSPSDPHIGVYALVSRGGNYEATVGRVRALSLRIKEAGERRMNYHLSEQLAAMSGDPSISPAETAAFMQAELEQIRPKARGADTTIASAAAAFRSQIDEWRATPGALRGVSTGLRCLDRITKGARRGALWVIGGRTSMGKTALSLTMLRHAAFMCPAGHLVAMISLEMSTDQLMLRLAAMLSSQSASAIENGAADVDWDAVYDAVDLLGALPMRIIDARGANNRLNGDRGRLTPEEIRRHVLAWRREGIIDLLIVDYLELVQPPHGMAKAQRDERLSAISTALKSLAEEADTAVVLLTQLNREAENSGARIPSLATVRGGDGPANDADVVIFPVRYDYWRKRGQDVPPEVASKPPGYTDIMVAKQRNGDVGMVSAYYLADQMAFVDYDNERDVPYDFQGRVIHLAPPSQATPESKNVRGTV